MRFKILIVLTQNCVSCTSVRHFIFFKSSSNLWQIIHLKPCESSTHFQTSLRITNSCFQWQAAWGHFKSDCELQVTETVCGRKRIIFSRAWVFNFKKGKLMLNAKCTTFNDVHNIFNRSREVMSLSIIIFCSFPIPHFPCWVEAPPTVSFVPNFVWHSNFNVTYQCSCLPVCCYIFGHFRESSPRCRQATADCRMWRVDGR